MDIKNKEITYLDGFKHYLITPIIQKGNYVIKFKKNLNTKPFKVQILINNLT